MCLCACACVRACVHDSAVTAEYNFTHDPDHMTSVSDLSPLCEHQSDLHHTPEAVGQSLGVLPFVLRALLLGT